jgi:hypothetical protein
VSEVIAPHILDLELDGGQWSVSRLGRFTPRERAPGTHCIGGWVSPRAVLDAVVKRKISSLRRESNARTPIVHPVAQCSTDSAITALNLVYLPDSMVCAHFSRGMYLCYPVLAILMYDVYGQLVNSSNIVIRRLFPWGWG